MFLAVECLACMRPWVQGLASHKTTKEKLEKESIHGVGRQVIPCIPQ